MRYNLFLFDLDDTLLDFRESERRSFVIALESLGITENLDALFARYQIENTLLWALFEQAKTTKEYLKVERFRKTFAAYGVEIDPVLASVRYLDTLPQTVVLVEYAKEICEWLTQFGEIGIITNGIQSVQTQRIRNSAIAPYISFVSVSETCGFAKPDVRFFEHSITMAKQFARESCLVVGDRMDADIQGAFNFGVDSCWFNPTNAQRTAGLAPQYEIHKLVELQQLLAA